jgi:hypothetical protein
MAVPDSRVQHAYRVRVSLFLLAVMISIMGLAVAYRDIHTPRVLDAVEHARARWQKPAAVMEPATLPGESLPQRDRRCTGVAGAA